MINAKPRWIKNYIDVLDRATTDAVTKPAYAQMVKDNGLIARHIRSGYWATRDLYYSFRHDGAEAFNYYNWKAPASFKITKVGTTTFTTKTKVLFGGSAGYYNTNYVPASHGSDNFTLNDASIGGGVITHASQFIWGCNNLGGRYILFLGPGTSRFNVTSSSIDVTPDSGVFTGKFLCRRISSTQLSFFRNGATDGVKNQTVDTADVSAQALYLGCRNSNGAATGAAGVELSHMHLGSSISDALALQAYNDEVAYEASL